MSDNPHGIFPKGGPINRHDSTLDFFPHIPMPDRPTPSLVRGVQGFDFAGMTEAKTDALFDVWMI